MGVQPRRKAMRWPYRREPNKQPLGKFEICDTFRKRHERKKPHRRVSVYKGVNYQTQAKKWKAQIGFNRQRIYLGIFTSEREAAEAYNTAAIERYGEYAKLNIFED